ncbi:MULTISPECIES: hypothetical protein [unclassified Methylibium]|jgi:hypothetical protein|uniref:hypothetical protein n=1 Tax=unclassified Methylibium TaxID=2633235 RepID=UPI0006F58243|nr:hypothetical protein [Methylibium sp. Root1272]KQW76622.1 hypothetical protein ASC67_02940 [Methylibium sp. Root1272]
MPNSLSLWRRARFGMLLIPALLGGCYVVPVVPVQRPIYGPGYDRPYPRPYYRGYYRVGEAAAPVVASAAATGAPEPHIEAASMSR